MLTTTYAFGSCAAQRVAFSCARAIQSRRLTSTPREHHPSFGSPLQQSHVVLRGTENIIWRAGSLRAASLFAMLHGRECGPPVHNSRRGPRCRLGVLLMTLSFRPSKVAVRPTWTKPASCMIVREFSNDCRVEPAHHAGHDPSQELHGCAIFSAMFFICMHMVITSCKYVMACVWVRSSNSHPYLQDQPDRSVRHAPGSCARGLRLHTASCKERQERCFQQRSQKEVRDKQKHGGTTTSRDIFLFQNKDPIARATPPKKKNDPNWHRNRRVDHGPRVVGLSAVFCFWTVLPSVPTLALLCRLDRLRMGIAM